MRINRSHTIKCILAIIVFFLTDFTVSAFLKYGLDKGMGLNEHSQVLIVGHSHLMMGLDRQMMEKGLRCKVTKHTRAGVGIVERELMVQMFLSSQYADSLKVVVIGVDPYLFNDEGLSENSFTLFYPWMDNVHVGEYIYNATDFTTYYAHKLFRTAGFSDDLIKQSVRGWKHDDRNYKTHVFTDTEFQSNKAKWDRPIVMNSKAMKVLEEIITMCTNRNLHVILLQAPVLKSLTDLHRKDYSDILAYYQNLDADNSKVHFLNLSPSYENDNSLFFDPIHLNVCGQKKVTEDLIGFLAENNYLQ